MKTEKPITNTIRTLLLELNIINSDDNSIITLSQVQNYLRDEEKFIVLVYYDNGKYWWESFWDHYEVEFSDDLEFDNYELCLIDGLIESLIDLKVWKQKKKSLES